MSFKKTIKQEEQMRLLISKATHVLSYGGGRSGKTFGNIRWSVLRRFKYAGSRGLIGRNTLKSVKASIIADTLPKVMSLCFPGWKDWRDYLNKDQWYLQFPNGSQLWFAGIGNPDEAEKILGMEFTDILLSEVSELSYRAVLKIRSRLAQKIDGCKLKAIYECNPPERGHWSYKEFIEHVNPLDIGQKLDPAQFVSILMNPKDNLDNINEDYINLLESMPEEEKNRFLYGLWGEEVFGTVFGKQINKLNQVGDYPYNPKYPVYVSYDIGYADATALWFYQYIDGNVYFIDCYDAAFEGLPHYMNVVDNKPYQYAIHYLPHDGSNHEWALGRSRRAIMIEDYNKRVEVLPRLAEGDQVSLVRQHLPRCYFDRVKCAFGLQSLKAAKYEYNEKLGVFKPQMLHDENSHYAKSFIYAIMSYSKFAPEIKFETLKEREDARLEEEQALFNALSAAAGTITFEDIKNV